MWAEEIGCNDAEFITASEKARAELCAVEQELERLKHRRLQLLQMMAAVGPLIGSNEWYAIKPGVTLADAIRHVAAYATDRERGKMLWPVDIRDLLLDVGYDLHEYKNHMASIHTALKRMSRNGEFKVAEDNSGGYYWVRKPENPRLQIRAARAARSAATGD